MADNAKKNILTYAGLQELEAELEDLKVNKRKEVAQKIKEAREQGDLSENAEYDEDLEFSIVGSTQTNSLQGKISNESPIGTALIGHEVGDVVEVEIGETVSKYKVLEIKKTK